MLCYAPSGQITQKTEKDCGHYAMEHQDRLHRKLKGLWTPRYAASGKTTWTVERNHGSHAMQYQHTLHEKLKGIVDTTLHSIRKDYMDS
jgi:hypothetical protein